MIPPIRYPSPIVIADPYRRVVGTSSVNEDKVYERFARKEGKPNPNPRQT